VRKKRQRRGPEQSEGTAANESSSAARAERARTPRGGDTPALDPSVRGTPGRRVCRTAYLNTSDQCGFGMVASGIDLERPEPESSGLLVRRSGRDGGGEALTGLWTTESNTPAFKRC
jgi:hypothetical protein